MLIQFILAIGFGFGWSVDLSVNSPIVVNNVLEINGTLLKDKEKANNNEDRIVHFFLNGYEIKVSMHF